MIVLQGSWRAQNQEPGFFLWGEQWQGSDDVPTGDYPYGVAEAQLQQLLQQFLKPTQEPPRFQSSLWKLPSYTLKKKTIPGLSQQSLEPTHLSWQSWRIQGLELNPEQTLQFFEQLPLGAEVPRMGFRVGGSLRFFAHLQRWSYELVVRSKFVPGLRQGVALWWPLLDSIRDQTRLAQFTQALPAVVLAADFNADIRPQGLILDFLQTMLQTQIQIMGSVLPRAKDPWLRSLLDRRSGARTQAKNGPRVDSLSLQKLEIVLNHWQLPLQADLGRPDNLSFLKRQWRTVLQLHPPCQPDQLWRLGYGLQALADQTLFIDAEQIWHGAPPTLVCGEEILLTGLGLASQIYEPIAVSLEERSPTGQDLEPIQAYEFIRAVAARLEENGLGVILPAGLASTGETQELGLKIEAWLETTATSRPTFQSEVRYELSLMIGDMIISAADFEALLAQRSPLVVINQQWLILQPAQVRSAQTVLQSSLSPLPLTVEGALQLAIGESQTFAKLPLKFFVAKGLLQELLTTLQEPQGVAPIPYPPEFRGELRPYQARGVGWLAFMERWGLGACLADDMGLGKTPQLLGFLLTLKAEGLLKSPVLIVCPTSVISNWWHEIGKFSPTLKTLIHHGEGRKKGQPLVKSLKDYHLVLTSYALLHRDLSSLKLVSWQGIVLDEAQNIKNVQTQQSQAVRQLTAGFHIALTGTPVENRLSELWSILDFLNPGFLGSGSFFQKRFAQPIEKYGDHHSLYRLQNLVRPFILRRLKTDPTIAQELPEKLEMTVYCSLSQRQVELYQDLVTKSLHILETESGIKRQGQILALLTQLKQLCNHPAHLLKCPSLEPPEDSGKLLRLEAMLEEVIEAGDRALIFTQFTEWGQLLKPYLESKFKQEVLFLHGGTPRLQRAKDIERFQIDPTGPQLFLLSLKAGGTGLNLTRANHVFHIDRWWNPAVENQATDRAFRLGQTRNVQVHKFVCTGTLEEKIQDLISQKQDLAEQTITSGENWLGKLDTEQLRNLLLLDRSTVVLTE